MLNRLPLLLASLKTSDARSAFALAPVRFAAAAADGEDAAAARFTLLGYRQTDKPACKGGRANANFFRFRHKRMRAIARTFRGNPFITGHDWGDVRARGGTIVDAWAEPPPDAGDELAFFAVVEATADWAKLGLKDGTIDRFSIGAFGRGEITCTVHGSPVWTDCWCWPGYEAEGGTVEWEYEDAEGVEISAVNVPAVGGTGIVDAALVDGLVAAGLLRAEGAHDHALAAADIENLARLCGRSANLDAIAVLAARAGGAPKGGFPRETPGITMASHDDQRGKLMDRALLCQTLGLAATATDDEILARIREQGASAAQTAVLQAQIGDLSAARERDSLNAHVEAEITRLRAGRQVGDQVIASLRALIAAAPGANAAAQRASFDTSLKLVEASAPTLPVAGAAPAARATLQSDARAADAPGAPVVELDAYEQHKGNPHLGRMMKLARLSADDVRKHGSVTFNVVPNLRELADATDRRGA